MKKIILLLILVLFFISCGPHRMKCGPGRCGLDETYSEIEKKSNLLSYRVFPIVWNYH